MARDLVRLMLGRAGFDVFEAVDGQDALEKIKGRRPDLIILDVMMPGLDGFAVCRAIRDNSATADIPVIMLSARTHANSVQEGLDAGANKYLSKLISRSDLIQNIREALGDLPEADPDQSTH
jgi:DNA-binding response OmpR family regulator